MSTEAGVGTRKRGGDLRFRCIVGELERFLVVERPRDRVEAIARKRRRNPEINEDTSVSNA